MIILGAFVFACMCNAAIKNIWLAALVSSVLNTAVMTMFFIVFYGGVDNWHWYFTVYIFAVTAVITIGIGFIFRNFRKKSV